MSQKETGSRSTGNPSKLKVVRKEGNDFVVKVPGRGTFVKVEDTYSEMFPLWVGRILITADSERWALIAAQSAIGFATSIIGSPAECGIDKIVTKNTPDNRPGVSIQIYQNSRRNLLTQLLDRIGQCILTSPTSSAFNGLSETARKVKIGASLRFFGDGFERKGRVKDRNVWRIPVMEGEFIVENRFGVKKGVAGGNFLILAKDQKSGLKAAEKAAEVARDVEGTILPFPGGVCRSGTKVGSMKYKLRASTNHAFCPVLRNMVSKTSVPEGVNSVYEIVINGLDIECVKDAMSKGIMAALEVPGVIKVTAANYGGELGPYKAYLKEILSL
jgi:formylmethanofuran--tetrahydromethanopterin N-formyltransferase